MAKAVELTLPHRYEPRPYQVPLLRAMDQGCKRAFHVWHRRAGKEKTDLAGLMSRKMYQDVGLYWYVFPTFVQGRKVLWDGIDRDGFRLLDHFPERLFPYRNDTEMKVRAANGSLLQVVGSDNFNSLMGANPRGVVLSEYALQDPNCWSFIRPILAENDGWAVFNTTPRGENHAYDLWELARANPFHPATNKLGWFTSLLTVADTGAIRKEVLEQERLETIRLHGDDSVHQQEYYCNFTVAIPGAYYAAHIARAYRDGRVGTVPHEPSLKVDTVWDLGMNDRTSIWFIQAVGPQIRVIDYMEGTGKGIPDYIAEIKQTRPHYVFGRHVGPHDIEVRDLSVAGGKTRRDVARALGFDFMVAPKVPVNDGIEAARNVFGRCWFDKDACRPGINALKSYRKQWDEKRRTFLNQPFHDWSSNAADAFRYLALTLELRHESGKAAPPDKYERKRLGGQGEQGGVGLLG